MGGTNNLSNIGKTRSEETKDKISKSTKGISYEERYGKEEADRRKEICRLAWIKRKLN